VNYIYRQNFPLPPPSGKTLYPPRIFDSAFFNFFKNQNWRANFSEGGGTDSNFPERGDFPPIFQEGNIPSPPPPQKPPVNRGRYIL